MSRDDFFGSAVVVVMVLIGFLLIAPFLTGCNKVVYIPTKCDITMPSSPLHTNDYATNLKNMSIYAQELECGLSYCINGSVVLNQCKDKK